MIYLDANSTSRLRPEAAEILSLLCDEDGLRNPSSVHELGRKTRLRLNSARKQILGFLGLPERSAAKLIFTSGGTEACNLMITGFLGGPKELAQSRGHILTSAIEHPAMLETFTWLESQGWSVRKVLPEASGIINPAEYKNYLAPQTSLVCLMSANNETGAMQPVSEVAKTLRSVGYAGPIICDFTQSLGKTSTSAADLFSSGVSAIAISGHKIGAPAGIGALILSEAADSLCYQFEPLLRGGPQEGGFRAGTENIFGALSFGAVCEALGNEGQSAINYRRSLRERLWSGVRENLPNVFRVTPEDTNGDSYSLSNTLMLAFEGCRGDDLVVSFDLNGLAASTGSACASGKQSVSHVITAMGWPTAKAREVVRFSIDWDANEDMIDRAVGIISNAVKAMRHQSSLEACV